jgi:cell division protease FtsH
MVGKQMGPQKDQTVSYSDLLNRAEEGKIKDVTIEGNIASGDFANNEKFHTILPPNDQSDMDKTLRAHGVSINYKDQNSNFWISTLISIPSRCCSSSGSSCSARCSPAAIRP